MSVNRVYLDDVIGTYFEMGNAALERCEYSIAQKMFKAVFEEPSSKLQKDKIMLPLLIASAQAHEGLKQLYKAKLLYIRALALKRKKLKTPDMQSVEILLTLSHLTAQQGLYRQALDFAEESFDAYQKCSDKDPINFVRSLRRIEKIMDLKCRKSEQEKVLTILQGVRSEAIRSFAKSTDLMPSENVIPIAVVPAVMPVSV